MLTTKDNINFKKVNRNLKKELSECGFDISNQSCLNLLSKSLGYKNYNTYLGLNPEIINIQNKSLKDYLINEIDSSLDFSDKERVSNYNEVEQLVYFTKFNNYEILIDKEISSNGDKYFLQFREKENYTKRVLYAPRYQTFSLYVYPVIEEAYNDYYFDIKHIEKQENLKYFFRDTINHLDEKVWYNLKIHNDLLDLMNSIYNDRESLSNFIKQYPEELLKEKYESSPSSKFYS